MPRSNKKRNPQKLPPKSPTFDDEMETSNTISNLMSDERNTMITRAICSAKHHEINLKSGNPTAGEGDCAFEAVVNNNNERKCFKEKFPLSITSYRQIWVTDMANRTVDTEWNIFSPQEWLAGWQEMLVPGTYERDIYGDLMLPGIACGIKKYILIFNTNLQSPHDPIYVVDPRKFNVQPDTVIPIILAYNLSHYESLHPNSNRDMLGTINLVKEYLENRYRYSRKDFPLLLGVVSKQPENRMDTIETDEIDLNNIDNFLDEKAEHRSRKIQDHRESMLPYKLKNYKIETNSTENEKESKGQKRKLENPSNKSNENDFEKQKKKTFKKPAPKKQISNSLKSSSDNLEEDRNSRDKSENYDIDLNEVDKFLDGDTESRFMSSEQSQANLTYKLKNKGKELKIVQDNGKMICPFCKISIKNIKINFDRHVECGRKIDMDHFLSNHNEYLQEKRRNQLRIAQMKRKTKLKEENREKFREDNNKAVKKSQIRAKEKDAEKFRKAHNEAAKKSKIIAKEKDAEKFRKANNEAVKKSQKQKKQNVDETTRLNNFNKAVLFGPIFICSCCKRKLYENGVTKINDEFKEKVNKKKSNLYMNSIPSSEFVNIVVNGKDDKSGIYICHTCKTTMLNGKIPSMSIMNELHLTNILEGGNLTELENNLIAQNINFQYIFCLKKSRWAATKKQMISVPVTVDKILDTIQQIPRLPRDAGLVQVKLKRKRIYERSHKKEYINPEKIFKVLHYLKKMGHPYYQFYEDFKTYKNRCKIEDDDGHSLLFENDEKSNEPEQEDDIDDSQESDIEEEHANPIRKHQFDYNSNTCMTNNYPEMFIDNNGNQIGTKQLEFAPAEGNYPTNLLKEKDWDIKSWPALLPDGKFGIHYKRKVRLTDQQYFEQRLLNKDPRFSKSPGYIFAAAAYIEQKQLSSKANISFMRGKKTTNSEGTSQYDLDDAFTTFDGVRNTPKYWQKVKYEMIAKLENLGPFHFFFTLSCGDTRCDENFSTFLVENGYLVEYQIKDDGTTETIVKSKDERQIEKSLQDFLQEDVDDSLHEMIRTNVLTATRNFQHRVDAFRTEIIMGENNPMKVKHISYRVEFQGRGA